ncbi:hypothetical protein NC652_020846 [Populus alba x Populus x berolinensis]|nr:hypothetical protein NC652_020846 [Populus alba x Populus x berolinensis]
MNAHVFSGTACDCGQASLISMCIFASSSNEGGRTRTHSVESKRDAHGCGVCIWEPRSEITKSCCH